MSASHNLSKLVTFTPGVSRRCKDVLQAIVGYAQHDGTGCTASVSSIAFYVQYSRSDTFEALAELKAGGYIVDAADTKKHSGRPVTRHVVVSKLALSIPTFAETRANMQAAHTRPEKADGLSTHTRPENSAAPVRFCSGTRPDKRTQGSSKALETTTNLKSNTRDTPGEVPRASVCVGSSLPFFPESRNPACQEELIDVGEQHEEEEVFACTVDDEADRVYLPLERKCPPSPWDDDDDPEDKAPTEADMRREFNELWRAFPARDDNERTEARLRSKALWEYKRQRKLGRPYEFILQQVHCYAADCDANDIVGTQFVAQLRTFLRDHLDDEFEPPPRPLTCHARHAEQEVAL